MLARALGRTMRALGVLYWISCVLAFPVNGRATVTIAGTILAVPFLADLARRAPTVSARRWLLFALVAALVVATLFTLPWVTALNPGVPNVLAMVAASFGSGAYCRGMGAWFSAGSWPAAANRFRTPGTLFLASGALAATRWSAHSLDLWAPQYPFRALWVAATFALGLLYLTALILLSGANHSASRVLRTSDTLAPGFPRIPASV